ncbi:MAG: sigma-54-dependent Fis family transcriptional regulator [Bacillota bacterium]
MNFFIFKTEENARDMFEEKSVHPANVHPVLLDSWQRSRLHNVNPFIEAAPTVSWDCKNDLDNILIKIAKPYFSYYKNLLLLSECVFSIANSEGIIICVETKFKEAWNLLEKHNYMVSSSWNEQNVGTNGISLVLKEKNNVIVHGREHYSYCFNPYSCMASPIFHPLSKEVVGVLNLCTWANEKNVHTMGWVAATARLIESGLGIHILNCDNNNKQPKNISQFFVNNNPIVKTPSPEIIGKDHAFLFALNLAEKAAKADLNILLTGETGTGKDLFAREIHNSSQRSSGPYVAINCGAIPKELIASELFGYSEGAFTGASRRGHPGRFEQADGGTIFLDEIGDAPNEVQIGLLRVIEEGCVYRLGSVRPTPVNVRVLAATSRDLNILVQNGDFRKDLYYRLTGVNIMIPPLRERKEDISLLVEYYWDNMREKYGHNCILSDDLMEFFQEHDWPGNVRELKNTVERLAGLAGDQIISRELLAYLMPKKIMPGITGITNNISTNLLSNNNNKLSGTKINPKKDALIKALNETGGKIGKASELLGINRSTVYRRMKKYGIMDEC